ncbi:TolC family protein, partial [Pyxidicoccus trucidator]|uniref:TolC family protein n=1 Tax=Pyxidicoccus trucidator TaxID=2709662 RepID=UPI0013DCE712
MATSSVLLLALAATSIQPEQTSSDLPPVTAQPKVEDAMLTPVPPAPRLVKTWDEALTLVLERSTDLRSVEAGVQRASGRWRQALSALLPNARAQASVAIDVLNPDTPAVTNPGTGAGTSGRTPTAPLGTVTATLTQSVVDLGAWRGLSSARAAETGAVASLQDARRRLTLGLAQVLVATVAAERAAEINRVGLQRALEREALTR